MKLLVYMNRTVAKQASETSQGQPYVGLPQMLRVLALRSALRKRDKWSPEQLRRHQEEALKKVRAYAYANSPFYKRFHQGLYDAPLKDLPVLTKSELMKNWDEVITDRTVKLRRSGFPRWMARGKVQKPVLHQHYWWHNWAKGNLHL